MVSTDGGHAIDHVPVAKISRPKSYLIKHPWDCRALDDEHPVHPPAQ